MEFAHIKKVHIHKENMYSFSNVVEIKCEITVALVI